MEGARKREDATKLSQIENKERQIERTEIYEMQRTLPLNAADKRTQSSSPDEAFDDAFLGRLRLRLKNSHAGLGAGYAR